MRVDASNENSEESTKDTPESPEMTLLQTTQSVLWAMLGVQSQRNAKRDFSKGKFSHFVIIGLVFTGFFVLTLVSIIRWVLADLT